jgi:hypothetical protein
MAQRGTIRYDSMNYGGGRGDVGEPTGAPAPGILLARRLRELRRDGFPGVRLTQKQLASALSQDEPVADSTLSAWENTQFPTLPPHSRLSAYALFFASERSLPGEPHLLSLDELTAEEDRVRRELELELFRLRDNEPEPPEQLQERQFWRFDDGAPITVICSDLRQSDELELGPLAQEDNPNFADLYSFGDLDALFALYGHLRATNPRTPVHLRRGAPPDLLNHLVVLGGIAWNEVTRRLEDLVPLPVRQVEDTKIPSGEIFVTEDGEQFEPRWRNGNPGTAGKPGVLLEDVGMLARVPNPYNVRRTLTYCNGVHSRGVLGAVRCLTDPDVRQDNEQFLEDRFSGTDRFAILMRVPVLGGQTVSPSLHSPGTVVFKWPPDPPEN